MTERTQRLVNVPEMRKFALAASTALVAMYLVELLTLKLFGQATMSAVFQADRQHWYYMWTPFTSAISHGSGGHLLGNLVALLLCGVPVAMLVGAKPVLRRLYAAAVLGQLMGVVSGKGDLIGASAGVMAGVSWAVLTSPLWIRRWAGNMMKPPTKAYSRLEQLLPWLLLASFILLIGMYSGLELAANVQGVITFARYPWGGAPAGPGYSAHIFGFALGVFLAAHTWYGVLRHRARSDRVAQSKQTKPAGA